MTLPGLLIVLLGVTSARDTLQVRQGFFIGFGLGPGLLSFHCRNCPEAGTAAATHGRLRVGSAIGSRLTLGLDLELWRRQGNDDGGVMTTATCTFYPKVNGGGFIQAGIGRATFQGVDLADGPREKGDGPAALLAIGYDARFDQRRSLTPMLSLGYSGIGTTHLFSQPQRRGVHAWLAALSIGITWH